MNIRKFTLATVAASVVMWLTAGLWHKVILAQFYTEQTGADHGGTGVILIAYLILAAMMTSAYPKLNITGKPLVAGLKFGVFIGVLWVFPHELAMAGAHSESLVYPFQNAAVHIVEQGVGGILIALIYKNES